MISLQFFAHDTTAQLLCHVQNIVAIGRFEFRCKQNETIELKSQLKNC